MDIFEKLDDHLKRHRIEQWKGTFREYMSMVVFQPTLSRTSHARLYDMIKSAGVQVDDNGIEHHAFF